MAHVAAMQQWIMRIVGVLAAGSGALKAAPERGAVTTWTLDAPERVGGGATEVLGAPRADGTDGLLFDGVGDGVIVPTNPLAGLPAWTIEVLIRPEEGGLEEQRFLHVQEDGADPRRALIETRLDGQGGWWLDTFLRSPAEERTLIVPARVHPVGRWHWVALRYDGVRMEHFVDGVKEADGPVAFGAMSAGRVSLGVRLNRKYWFKGAIREVRWTAAALPDEKLQRVK